MALECHRLDVEPGALGVEAREVAQGVVGRDFDGRRADTADPVGRRAVLVDRPNLRC